MGRGFITPSLILFVCVLSGAYAGFFYALDFPIWLGFIALFLPSKTARAVLILLCAFSVSAFLAEKRLENFKQRESRIPKEMSLLEGVVEEVSPSLLNGKKLQVRLELGFRLMLSLRDGAALVPVEQGDRIRIQGKIKHLQHAMAPGEFDSYWFGVSRHFEGRMSIHSPFKIKIIEKGVEKNFWAELRQDLRKRWMGAVTPREASVLLALTIGDTAFFEQEQKEIYQLVGAGHLLAVSGLQVSCLSFLFFYFFRFILLLLPWFGRLSRARVPAVLLTLISIWAFVVLSGSSASAVRSGFMSSVILLGLLLGRSSNMLDSFGIAGFITVLVAPESVLDPSFTLSYLAIFGILIGGSLGAGIITLPLSAYYFGMLALGGLLANLILVPIAVFLQTPAIFLSVIGFVHEAAYLAGMIEALCEALGDFIGGYIVLVPPAGWQVVACLIAFILFFTAKRKQALVLCALLVVPNYVGTRSGIHIAVLPAGQGDASVFEFPNGRIMLIDGGPREDYLLNYLKQKRISRIDFLVLSHPDADHIVGFFRVLEELEVLEIWHSGFDTSYPLMRKFLALAKQKNILIKIIPDLIGEHQIGDSLVTVLAPKLFDSQSSANNNSLVLKISLGRDSALWPGDLESEKEQLASPEWKANLLKAGHHGSKTSSSEQIVKSVAPEHVIFCTQAENNFGFPHEEITKRWEATGAKLWDTGTQGKIDVTLTGNGIFIKTFLRGS